MRAGPFPTEAPRGIVKRGRTRTCGNRNQNPAPWPAWRRAQEFGPCNLVLPTGVQPAKSSVESAVPLAPGDGRLVRAAGIEPNTSCLEDRHAAHYATPARIDRPEMDEGGPVLPPTGQCSSVFTVIRSIRDGDRPPGSRDGESTGIEPVRPEGSRRVSTALPYRSANSSNS